MSMKSGADPGFCQDEVTASEDKSSKAETGVDWGPEPFEFSMLQYISLLHISAI